jgi:hypothetical protein
VQDFASGRIARRVQQLHAGNGPHRLVVGKSPDDFFVGRDFDEMRRLAELIVAEPVCYQRVSIGQALERDRSAV